MIPRWLRRRTLSSSDSPPHSEETERVAERVQRAVDASELLAREVEQGLGGAREPA